MIEKKMIVQMRQCYWCNKNQGCFLKTFPPENYPQWTCNECDKRQEKRNKKLDTQKQSKEFGNTELIINGLIRGVLIRDIIIAILIGVLLLTFLILLLSYPDPGLAIVENIFTDSYA